MTLPLVEPAPVADRTAEPEPSRTTVRGWCLLAFERELTGDLTPAAIGTTRLVIARTVSGVRVFDADCPHRGANLGCGGRLDGDRIVCPFHGYRIGLGRPGEAGLRVREYPSLLVSGLLFARLTDDFELGLTAHLEHLDATSYLVPGFSMPVQVGAAWVTENGLDYEHFKEVHGIKTRGDLLVRTGECGELRASGELELPHGVGLGASAASGPVRVSYEARVYSPWLIVSEVGGARPYTIVTGATPAADGACVVRLALIAPPVAGRPPSTDWCQSILRNSRDGLEKDRAVWEGLSLSAPTTLTPRDAPVLAFRAFCRQFWQGDSTERTGWPAFGREATRPAG